MSQFVTCDACDHRLHDVPFTIIRTLTSPGGLDLAPLTLHACSTACLVRLASSIHRPPTAPTDELEAIT